MNRSIRTGAALAGVAGVVALAGCGAVTVGATADDETATTDASSGQATDSGTVAYADGTYTAEGSYQTPETVETVSVTVTIEDDVVTAVEVTGDPQAAESRQYQSQFIAGIADEVVGVALDDLAVDRVAGSSLTSGGFNAAIEQIKQDAAV
ncbi:MULTISPECIES: FMN-binding protein [Microbacterium]|uniref:FMN-binding domain-containing protein n=1 Tax=Microbacterium barkeri TaxID=33917 RepID=A0A9W6H4D2_9MICO|nr:FMN-binding protein [Microbacterium barkeri]MDR6876494.1 uncharacterized protein with FMN-binding domain [Microbacterium barkeri]GLJ62121.1 hypothetical protein GCM10017576_22510 [Microbacterium barkeri]